MHSNRPRDIRSIYKKVKFSQNRVIYSESRNSLNNYLNNYLTRVRLSVSLFVCLSVAMVPTLRHLRLRAAQTVSSSWVKFAQFVEDELGHLHVEKRVRWGARWARGTSWKSANLRHRVCMLKSRREIGEKCEKPLNTGRFPGRCLGYQGSDWQATNTAV